MAVRGKRGGGGGGGGGAGAPPDYGAWQGGGGGGDRSVGGGGSSSGGSGTKPATKYDKNGNPIKVKKPIGVPADFKAKPAQWGGWVQQKPRYHEGAQWYLSGRSPDEIVQTQQALVKIGLLKPGKFQPGKNDKATRSAMTEVFGRANAEGKTWREQLVGDVALAEEAGWDGAASGSERAPLQVELTNPKDIESDYQAVATDSIGRYLSPKEIAAKVAKVQGEETAAQTTAYNQGETGGTVTKPESETKQNIDNQFRQEHPEEYQATQIGEKARAVMEAFTGGVRAGSP